MALVHQAFSRCIQSQRLLLCTTHLNTLAQKRGFFYKKKKDIWTDETPQWLYHKYKFNMQELKSYLKKRHLREIKDLQKYDEVKVTLAGVDLAAAHMVIKLGGKVKFVGDEIWYQKFENQLPLPSTYEEGYLVEGIDVSNIVFLHEALEYFNGLIHVKYVRFSKSKYVDDWYIEKITETFPNLEALDISDCPTITDNGLEMLHRLKNLKVVNITNCHRIKCSEAICALLYDIIPDLNVIGLDSLSNVLGSEDLLEYELENSRYMSWGLIMNQRLGLNNEINFDEFMESQMKKLGINSDKDSARIEGGKENETDTCDNSSDNSYLNNSVVNSANT